MSIRFGRDCGRKQREFSNNKNLTGKYHAKIILKDVFDLAEDQEKATYGLGYRITLTRNNKNCVDDDFIKAAAARIIHAKNVINAIDW